MLLVKEFGGSSAYPVGQMLKAKKTHEKLLLKRGIGGLTMRIIDADELLQKMQTEYDSTDRLIDQGELHLDTLAEGYTEVHMLIESLPTIDPESLIPHGWWEIAIGYDPRRSFQCSECWKMAFEPSKYCPNCGAKMDKA